MRNRIEQFTPLSTSGTGQAASSSEESSSSFPEINPGEVMRQLEVGVRRHPVLAVSLGLCAGAVLGWLIKRR